jgi:hypothetical protein
MTAEPSVDSSGVAAAKSFDRPTVELGRWAVGTLVGLLWCAALLIGWRRLAEALSRPLEAPVLLVVAVLVAAVSIGLRTWWHRLPREHEAPLGNWLVAILPSAAVLCLGAALSLPGTTVGGLVAFWVPVAVAELWAWRPMAWRRLRQGSNRRPTPRPPSTEPERVPPLRVTSSQIADDVPAENVLQQITRSHAADGSEQLSGWLRMPFAAGQRTAIVHLNFCPQFAKAPELTVEQLASDSEQRPEILRINKTVHSFGARLDLKLASPAEEPLDVLLRFSARSKPPAPTTTGHQNTP